MALIGKFDTMLFTYGSRDLGGDNKEQLANIAIVTIRHLDIICYIEYNTKLI